MSIKNRYTKGCVTILLISFVAISIYFAVAYLNRWLPIDQQKPSLASPSQFTQEYCALEPKNAVNAIEISAIRATSDSNEVITIFLSIEKDTLFVVYDNGLIRQWDIDTRAIEAEFDFMFATRKSVQFNGDGSQVITPGMVLPSNLIYGYTLWDTSSGKVIKCRGDHCADQTPRSNKVAKVGQLISNDGNWIVDYKGSMIGSESLFDGQHIFGLINVDPNDFDNKFFTLDYVKFDATGTYIASSIEEGQLKIYHVDDEFIPPRTSGITLRRDRTYGRYNSKERTQTSDLSFDDTMTWMAWLTDDHLIVYDLHKMIFPTHMKVSITDGNLLAFNHFGNLLAVATDGEILMFDPAKKEKVASFEVGEATALFFTHDDRLLAWGDEEGVVHLWGVKKEGE